MEFVSHNRKTCGKCTMHSWDYFRTGCESARKTTFF